MAHSNLYIPYGLAAALTGLCVAFSGCTNEASQSIGGSLIEDETQVIVADSFAVDGHTLDNGHVQGRTITQLLGRIDAQGYGRFESDFVTQFMPTMTIDTTGVSVDDIDSLMLYLAIPKGGIVGDSLMPMGLEVFALTRQLQSPIYSNFNPEGYYDPSQPIGRQMYACNALMATDSVKQLSYREVGVELPRSLGQRLFEAYKQNPANYLTPTAFADVFPGLYVRNTFGTGRVMKIQSTMMQLYFRKHMVNDAGHDTIVQRVGSYYAVSPEVVTNNNIDYTISPELEQRIAHGEQLIVAPAGRDIELTFPIQQVIDYYLRHAGSLSVLNTLTFKIPAEEIANNYGINPPQNLLLVLSSDKKEFFVKNSLPNNRTSFYATYSSGAYSFSGLRDYLIDMLAKSTLTPDDYTFTLTPVSVETETNQDYYYGGTTTTLSSINPYVETPSMVRLRLDKAVVTLTFTKQIVN